MTNEMIIQIETAKLAEQGVLQYTGRVLRGLNVMGEEVEIKEIEPIHTYKGWEKLGFKVKKGEHSKIKFPIWFWKKGKKKETENGEEEYAKGNCYMKNAAWFTIDQVEKVGEQN